MEFQMNKVIGTSLIALISCGFVTFTLVLKTQKDIQTTERMTCQPIQKGLINCND